MSWIGVDDLRDWLNIAWERINSLRPPAKVDFNWRSTWPVPLYGLACVAHRRFRALAPRRLPTITTVSLPEIYGIFALGHVAHLEANRLSRKVAEDPALSLLQCVASWARLHYRIYPGRFTTPIGSVRELDCTLYLINRQRIDELEVWKYRLRCSWASERARKAASRLLLRRYAQGMPELSHRDMALAMLFVAEELEGNTVFQPPFLRNRHLMLDAACFTLSAMLARWWSASEGVLRTNALLQRYFICLLAFKWLGGRYCHYASIFGLEQPRFAAFLASLSALDWEITYGGWVVEDPAITYAKLGLSVPPWFGDA